MNQLASNNSQLFYLLLGKPPTKLAAILHTVGISGFTLAGATQIVISVTNASSPRFESWSLAIFWVGISAGFLAFVGAAAIFVGRRAGKYSFLHQVISLLSKVFIYVLLPCILITVCLIIWAIATN